jgi:hypothetical protein
MARFMYLVDLELRYTDKPKGDNGYPNYINKTVTVGIYDTYEEAAKAGNAMLEAELESRFPLNKNWNRYNMSLISDLSYLTTPFSFFAHIKKLEIGSISDEVEEAINAGSRYKEWKNSNSEI